MTEVAQYLMDSYYSRYKGSRNDVIPTPDQLEAGIRACPDKVVVVKEGHIKGVAIFLLLTDESYKNLDKVDITQVDVLLRLIPENGKNMHFILLAADSVKTILRGLRTTINKVRPKTVSWWSPDFSKLHRFNLN
ncbi:hypothetical protein EKI60_06480 [Candidatus Saccharibacteria bacterium]|nr:MAG: hypothetical protein EKI60_06480 [Candidatus Saccharibacteria bacterium]